MAKPQPIPRKAVNLALQGGGSHGAFSWGVLDRLLEDPRIEFEAVTGASAGAMNAVVLADGLAGGSREEAREALSRFWNRVGQSAMTSPMRRSPIDAWRGAWTLDNSPGYIAFDLMARLASPYDLNPLGFNPLRNLVSELVDFERVRSCSALKLFVSATDVETGRARVFRKEEITVSHVMASACLPNIYQAVEIDSRYYWDGGFMGNPPLWPLFDACETNDVIIVQINPFTRPGVPRRAPEIYNRVNEITFNSSLMRELRAIDFVTRLLKEGRLQGTGYREVYVHMIGDENTLRPLGASSKLNAEARFLKMLFERGRQAAELWLSENFDRVGQESTLDIRAVFNDEEDPLDGERITRAALFAADRK
jgi:NTE family protein